MKLERSVSTALRKRPVAQERIDKLLSSIQRQLETSGESEVAASTIGEMVMNGLKATDTVAYIRFASVYQDFRDATDFEDVDESGRATWRASMCKEGSLSVSA